MKYALVLCLVAFSSQAAVYKCEQNGTVEFSQFPCATDAETLDMRPLGSVMLGSKGEYKQQVDALKRKSRFVEFQITKLQQERDQELEKLKADLYKLRRSYPRAEELTALQQKIDRTAEMYEEKIATERTSLNSLNQKVNGLERQYAQN